LCTDPLKLHFTTPNSTSGKPKNVIKRTTNQTLSEMIQAYLPKAHLLFYEMLDISIVDLEKKLFFKVIWLGNTVREKVCIMYLFPFVFKNLTKFVVNNFRKSLIFVFKTMPLSMKS